MHSTTLFFTKRSRISHFAYRFSPRIAHHASRRHNPAATLLRRRIAVLDLSKCWQLTDVAVELLASGSRHLQAQPKPYILHPSAELTLTCDIHWPTRPSSCSHPARATSRLKPKRRLHVRVATCTFLEDGSRVDGWCRGSATSR